MGQRGWEDKNPSQLLERVKPVVHTYLQNRPFRPVQAMCTIKSLRSGQKVGGSSSNSHGNWSAWQKTGNICSWRKSRPEMTVSNDTKYLLTMMGWNKRKYKSINGKRRTQHLKNPTHIKDTSLSSDMIFNSGLSEAKLKDTSSSDSQPESAQPSSQVSLSMWLGNQGALKVSRNKRLQSHLANN